jgi:predicted aspartyl protease
MALRAGAVLVIATTVPYQFIDNRVVIACRVDGRGPYSFVLDTGANATVITPELARALGLRTKAAGQTTGAGNGSQAISSTSLATLAIGSFSFAALQATVLDLREIKDNIGFNHFDGVIGYPVLAKFETKIDADRHTVTFSRVPLAVPKTAKRIAFTLDGGTLVHIPATIDGIAGSVVLDTGDRSSLTLFGPFAHRNHFYDKYPGLPHALTGFGIGGPIYGDVFRLPSFNVLGANLTGIVTRASRQTGGVFASGPEAGSIGGGVLRRFDIVYDYPDRVLQVWPSAAARARDPYDRSGMWLSRENGSVVVRFVAAGGPAAASGVSAGSTVVSMNGRPIGTAGIPVARAFLATAPTGTRVRLALNDRGKAETRTLELRDLL